MVEKKKCETCKKSFNEDSDEIHPCDQCGAPTCLDCHKSAPDFGFDYLCLKCYLTNVRDGKIGQVPCNICGDVFDAEDIELCGTCNQFCCIDCGETDDEGLFRCPECWQRFLTIEEKAETKLEIEVASILVQDSENHTNDSVKQTLKDLFYGGCQSGVIGEMIYYDDTVPFFERHDDEISKMLQESIESSGLSIDKLFGKSWDTSDPLARGKLNKNLLAWFGFEETARHLAEKCHYNSIL